MKRPGIVVTFYSYKGGVGRSLALANVAEILSQRGHDVICCDADLEAPGLETLLGSDAAHARELRDKAGLLDLLAEYRSAVAMERPEHAGSAGAFEYHGVRVPRPRNRLIGLRRKNENDGALHLLTAGSRAESVLSQYASQVQEFDWNDFYSRWAGDAFVDLMREDLCGNADFVLVDSRTGVTEFGGICTQHLADVVVLLTNATSACLDGTELMGRTLMSERVAEARGDAGLHVLPVAARVEQSAEKDHLVAFRQEFRERFHDLLRAPVDAARFLDDSEIPYVPFYGFGERLVAREGVDRLEELYGAYCVLGDALEASHEELRPARPEIAAVGAEPAKARGATDKQATPRVFVVRDFSIEGISFRLGELNEDPNITVPGLRGSPRQGQIFQEIREGIDGIDRVLALVDKPNANVGFELGYALARGKPVVLATAGTDRAGWLKRPPMAGHLIDRGFDTEQILEILAGESWVRPPDRPTPGDDSLFLCPGSGDGKAIRTAIRRERPGWRIPPDEGWTVEDLTEHLEGIGAVAWILTPYPRGSDERDGAENASAAIIAGFAHGCDLPVHVLRHRDMRDIVDVVHKERVFSTPDELETLLDEVHPLAPTQPDRPDPLSEYRTYARSIHNRVVPFFEQAAHTVLSEVFVELEATIDEEPSRLRDMDSLSVHGKQGSRSLRGLLENARLEDATTTACLAVLGDPGSGKTTTARHLVWELAGEPQGPVAVYATVTRLARERSHPFALAEEDVRMTRGDQAASGIEQALFDRAKRANGVWLLLDGLDEVAPDQQDDARQRLLGLADDLRQSVIVVLSRGIGFHSPGPMFRKAELKPLPEPRQRELLQRWLGNAAGDEAWSRLATRPSLKVIAGNPLMLTLIASLSLARPDLPASRVRLFKDAIRLLLERGFGFEPKPVADVRSARVVLGELALGLQGSASEAWPRDTLDDLLRSLAQKVPDADRWHDAWKSRAAFLEDVAQNSGVLAPHDGPREPWRFLHRQIRELLAAEALVGRNAWIDTLPEIDDDALPRWSETLGFACALAEDSEEAFKKLREKSAAAARRALPEIEGLAPEQMRDFLFDDDDWTSDDLVRVVRAWRTSGVSRSRATALLLETVEGFSEKPERLSMLWWTMEHEADAPDREAFFEACNRPLDKAPDLTWTPIRAGSFLMGSKPDEEGHYGDESPQHEVVLSAFEMAATPVTVAQFRVFRAEKKPAKGDLPVVNVSWWEAYLFCRWIGADLPSEAQWEYACRAESQTRFWSGDTEEDLKRVGWYDDNSNELHPVGELPANKFGLYDMHGNVWEWCEDTWHENYRGAPEDGTAWIESGNPRRVLRGGSFIADALGARSACRFAYRPADRGGSIGFRPARVITG